MSSEKANEPWYQDGLRFTCTQCGHCCTGEPGYVWVNEEEIRALAKFRKEPEREFVPLYTKKANGKVTLKEKANGDCVFFEAGKGCTVYSVRPRQCRTWPFWGKQFEEPRQVGTDRRHLPRFRPRRVDYRRRDREADEGH